MNHRTGRFIFAVIVGLSIAVISYRWATNPAGRENRAIEVNVVEASERYLEAAVAAPALEIVDPLSPNRKVGKVYVYPEEDGWSVSGYYRRDENDHWHPYLMMLDKNFAVTLLKTSDANPEFVKRAQQDPTIELVN